MSYFKDLRKSKGLSQAELARIINVDQTAVSKWELGKSFPDMEIAIRVADYFGVSVDYLLGRDTQKEKPATINDDELSALDKELIHLMTSLTPEEAVQARAFVQGLKAARNK